MFLEIFRFRLIQESLSQLLEVAELVNLVYSLCYLGFLMPKTETF